MRKFILRILLVLMMIISIGEVSGTIVTFSAEASVKTPAVILKRTTDYLNIGEKFAYSASTVGLDKKIVWSVSDSTVARISTNGVLTAIQKGFVTVYAKAGSKSAHIVLTVGSNRLGTLSTDITCYKDKNIYITADNYSSGEKLSAVIDHKAVAGFTIDKTWKDGKIRFTIQPKSIGSANITITTNKSNDRLVLHVKVVKNVRKKLTSQEVYKKCYPATVEITSTSEESSSLGSGFFIGNGIIVTNYHVIEGTENLTVATYDKKEYKVIQILGYDKKLDLAILKIKAENEIIPVSQKAANVGDNVYTIGSPMGLSGTMTKGMVSMSSRQIDDVEYVQIDASISRGNSGGPLVNTYGEVIGINTWYYKGAQNLNFSVSINEIQKINTNHPVTVEQYHTQYVSDTQKEFLKNMIHEDVNLSQNKTDCQVVPSDTGVDGNITSAENGDIYTFYMSDSGWFTADMELNSVLDTQNLNFRIFDSNNTLKGTAEKYTDDMYEYLVSYLTPGQYYIYVSKSTGYTGDNLFYLFETTTTYDYY